MISEKNTRTIITIPKDLKETLTALADKENRSFNNLVITILKDYAKEHAEGPTSDSQP